MNEFYLGKIIGLSVVAIRTFVFDSKRKKNFEPGYILFSDKKSYLELEEQDEYSFHDCNYSARIIRIIENPEQWKLIMTDPAYKDSDMDI